MMNLEEFEKRFKPNFNFVDEREAEDLPDGWFVKFYYVNESMLFIAVSRDGVLDIDIPLDMVIMIGKICSNYDELSYIRLMTELSPVSSKSRWATPYFMVRGEADLDEIKGLHHKTPAQPAVGL